MADVFVSYRRRLRPRVEQICSELSKLCITVWYDATIEPGRDFADEINDQLGKARCVLVCWSQDALHKSKAEGHRWVRSEALEAFNQGKLVQAVIENTKLTVPFNGIDSAFFGIDGPIEDTAWRLLISRIGRHLARPGLMSYLDVGDQPERLLEWTKKYPDDPLAELRRDEVQKFEAERDARLRAFAAEREERQRAFAEEAIKRLEQRWARRAAARGATAEFRDLIKSVEAKSLALESCPIRDAGNQICVEPFAAKEADCFAPNALRAIVCVVNSGPLSNARRPCLAVMAGDRMFIIDAGAGAAISLESHGISLGKLEALLLTGAETARAADLNELFVDFSSVKPEGVLPVYGPTDSHDVVRGVNAALLVQKMRPGLQPWAPAPEPGKPVIIFEEGALTVLAFTTEEICHTGRVAYRFDYRGRSLIVAGDGRAEWAKATKDADVILYGAQNNFRAFDGSGTIIATPLEAASAVRALRSNVSVLTGVEDSLALQRIGVSDVVAERSSMMIELPLTSQDVIVREL